MPKKTSQKKAAQPSATFDLAKLRTALDTVGQVFAGDKPAGLEELYSRVVFDGHRVFASNIQTSASTLLFTPFIGAVDGRTLMSFVATLSDSVKITGGDGKPLLLESGSVSCKLPTVADSEHQVIKPPAPTPDDPAGASEVVFDGDGVKLLAHALEKTLHGASKTNPRLYVQGVTAVVEGGEVILYGMSSMFGARCRVGGVSGDLSKLHGAFFESMWCKILVRELGKQKPEQLKIILTDDYVQAVFGDLVLQAQRPEGVNNLERFEGAWKKIHETLADAKEADVPEDLKDLISQAQIVLRNDVSPSICLSVKNKVGKLESGSESGLGLWKSDNIGIDLPDLTLQINPEYASMPFEFPQKKMKIAETYFYFTDADGDEFIVAGIR